MKIFLLFRHMMMTMRMFSSNSKSSSTALAHHGKDTAGSTSCSYSFAAALARFGVHCLPGYLSEACLLAGQASSTLAAGDHSFIQHAYNRAYLCQTRQTHRPAHGITGALTSHLDDKDDMRHRTNECSIDR